MLEVDGVETHLYCVGEGSPTVVLQAGAAGFAQSWFWIQQQLASSTRVCSYDRPGLGWSEAGAADFTGEDLAHHLYRLLEKGGEPGPYVMVGHSMGAPLVQIFAGLYPQEVVGVGLVDPSHPNLLTLHPAEAIPQKQAFTRLIRVSSVLAYTGIVRATEILSHKAEGLPGDAYRAATLFASSPQHLFASYTELSDWDATMTSARRYMQMHDQPLVVISASRSTTNLPERYMKPIQMLHADLAGMSSDSHHIKVADADHFTLLTKSKPAGATASALNELVLKVRAKPLVANGKTMAERQ